VFSHAQFNLGVEIAAPPATSATALTVHVPSIAEDPQGMHEWATGLYSVFLRVSQPNVPAWSTNAVPIALAPRITVSPLNAAAGDITVTVTCTPRLQKAQETQAFLVFGTQSVAPASVSTPGDPLQPTTLTFQLKAVTAGTYIVRLRVSGVDSLP